MLASSTGPVFIAGVLGRCSGRQVYQGNGTEQVWWTGVLVIISDCCIGNVSQQQVYSGAAGSMYSRGRIYKGQLNDPFFFLHSSFLSSP